MQRIFLWFVPVVLTVLGCGDGPGSCCVDGSSDAVVEGVVARVSGSPVSSAVLHMLVVDSAGGRTMLDEPRGGITDANGHFSSHLGAFLEGPFTGRVQITVRPPTAELADTTVDVGFLRFGRQPPDTSHAVIIYP
jgi:hypothetical protein